MEQAVPTVGPAGAQRARTGGGVLQDPTSDPKTMAMPASAAGTSRRPRRDPCRTRTDPRTRRHGVGSGPYTQRRLRTGRRTVRPGRRRSTGSVRDGAPIIVPPAKSLEPRLPICRPRMGKGQTTRPSALAAPRFPPPEGPACGWESTRRSGRPAAAIAARPFRCPHQRVVGRPGIDQHDFEKPVGLERTADTRLRGLPPRMRAGTMMLRIAVAVPDPRSPQRAPAGNGVQVRTDLQTKPRDPLQDGGDSAQRACHAPGSCKRVSEQGPEPGPREEIGWRSPVAPATEGMTTARRGSEATRRSGSDLATSRTILPSSRCDRSTRARRGSRSKAHGEIFAVP